MLLRHARSPRNQGGRERRGWGTWKLAYHFHAAYTWRDNNTRLAWNVYDGNYLTLLTQPRHARVGVEIHYLTLTSGFKSFSPILFMHVHRTSCSFNVKPGYHAYIYMYGNFSAPRLLLFLWRS